MSTVRRLWPPRTAPNRRHWLVHRRGSQVRGRLCFRHCRPRCQRCCTVEILPETNKAVRHGGEKHLFDDVDLFVDPAINQHTQRKKTVAGDHGNQMKLLKNKTNWVRARKSRARPDYRLKELARQLNWDYFHPHTSSTHPLQKCHCCWRTEVNLSRE